MVVTGLQELLGWLRLSHGLSEWWLRGGMGYGSGCVARTGDGVATGVAWVGTRSLWSKDRSQIRGFELAFNGHGVLASTATAIRSRVTAILLGMLGPTSLVVAPGTKITVVNQDRAPHTVTARDNSFDTGTIAGGQRAEITAPSSPGTYPYICAIYPSMTGTLFVK
jgi:plastocyanin